MRAALFVLLAACGPGIPGGDGDDVPPPPDGNAPPDAGILGYPWHLIWQDEFDGAVGSRPDPDKWSPDVGGDGWGNGQLEFDTDRTENASLDGDGHLQLVARREDYGGRAYTSARITTAGHFERAYGRFEARIQLPRGQGIWPAFWLLGANIGNVGWPDCGEIDIMENRGDQPTVNRGSLHGPGYSGGANHGQSVDWAVDLSAGFHDYAIEWDPDRVVFSVDGHDYLTATPADLPEGTTWVYDHTQFIILNVAVGGFFSGDPDGATELPQTMRVEYVRVYERIQ